MVCIERSIWLFIVGQDRIEIIQIAGVDRMIRLIDFNALIKRQLKKGHKGQIEIVFSHYSSLKQFQKLLESLNRDQLIELKVVLQIVFQKLIDAIEKQLKKQIENYK